MAHMKMCTIMISSCIFEMHSFPQWPYENQQISVVMYQTGSGVTYYDDEKEDGVYPRMHIINVNTNICGGELICCVDHC